MKMKANLQKMMKAMAGLLAVVLLAVGCTKEFDPDIPVDPGTPNNQKKLSKISYDDGSYLAVLYNAAGKPSKITTVEKTSSGDDTNVYLLAYNGDKLVDMTLTDGTKLKYTYTGANITKVEVVTPNNVVIAYYEYTYKEGRLWRTDVFSSFAGPISTTPGMRFEVDYYTNGNIKTMSTWYRDYTSGVLEKTDVYEMSSYDDKRNTSLLFENNPYLPSLISIPNNPLTEKHYDKTGQQYATVTHTYTYDADGNPIKRKTVTKETGLPDELSETTFQY
jgi:hypothetical protein